MKGARLRCSLSTRKSGVRSFGFGIVLALLHATTWLGVAQTFDRVVAFGDSLTDTGNEPAEPLLHYEGRWSNGPLWVEYLCQRLGLVYSQSNNFARSGAQCDDTYRQTTNYVADAGTARALFLVWAGGNDFLQHYDDLWFDDAGWAAQINYGVAHLSNAVVHLQQLGARTILVPNTVDITEIPTINYLPSFSRDYLRDQVKLFNRQLSNSMARLSAQLPALRLVHLDVYRPMKNLLRDARSYGFTEVNIDALADVTLLDKSFDGPGSNYLFWDPIHPTTKAHALLADWFQAAVAPMQPRLSLAGLGPIWSMTAESLHASKTYSLERSSLSMNWSNVATFVPVGSTRTWTVTNASPAAFYRLRGLF